MTNRPQRPLRSPLRRRPLGRAAALVAALLAGWPGAAAAAPPGQSFETVHVLELVQRGEYAAARGLTAALKQRVRDAPEHALGNTDLPFDALAAQCSNVSIVAANGLLHEPPRRCLDVVGRSLSGSMTLPGAYLWGAIYRPPGARAELRVRLHLWRERTDDRVAQDVVPEGADGEALDALAERLVARLLYPDQASMVRVSASGGREGELYVDGRPRGALRTAPRWFAVGPGEHMFELRAGLTPVARATARVGLADGLEVRLEPIAAAPPPAPTAPPPGPAREAPPVTPPRDGWKRTAGFVGLGLGAALIGAGVVTSLRVKALDDDLDTERPFVAYRAGIGESGDLCDAADADVGSPRPGAATAARVRRVCSGAATLQVAQLAFYGASALAVGAGAYLLATSSKAPATPRPAAWSVRPWAGTTGGGLRLGLTF